MFGILAIVVAIVFLAVSLWRFVPGAPRTLARGQLALALVAGALGLMQWSATGDSRWMIGALLLAGAAAAGWVAASRRGVLLAALVAGVLGAALYGVALARPMVSQNL